MVGRPYNPSHFNSRRFLFSCEQGMLLLDLVLGGLPIMSKVVPVTEFRSTVLKAVRKVQHGGAEYVITAGGKPAAVLMGFEEWENLIETLDIKRDKKLMKMIRQSRRYFRCGGKGKSYQKIDWN